MKCGILLSQKKQSVETYLHEVWLIKALDRATGGTIAWVLGKRDTQTFRKLYNKVKHLNKYTFYTDNWSAFAEVLPKQRHIIGKKYTTAVERDNSNTRHHLRRFTRRTKVVSQKEEMVEASLKLWQALTNDDIFKAFQNIALSIFR